MNILISYDVNTTEPEGQRRLRHVAKICQDYGQRVQASVFECTLTQKELVVLKYRLKTIIDEATDSIRIYKLSQNRDKGIECFGKDTSYNPEGILII
ncbi:MAG: CRISPR-associated endonuclease Cas2 [Bacteroides sp.]|nr:CRISPR-associated endonuclease Cas2 [Bacteroides sp.]MDE7509089.1 CRISPR-associated endonuclease Cas2 [Muribaculaceae bacterium]